MKQQVRALYPQHLRRLQADAVGRSGDQYGLYHDVVLSCLSGFRQHVLRQTFHRLFNVCFVEAEVQRDMGDADLFKRLQVIQQAFCF